MHGESTRGLPAALVTRTLDEHVEVLVVLASHVGGHTQVPARVRDLRGLDLQQAALAQDVQPRAGGHGLGGVGRRREGQSETGRRHTDE